LFCDLIEKKGIRPQGTIQIKFTPRAFPTPTRESQDQQEKEVKNNLKRIQAGEIHPVL
jgi:hypothetical protein